MPPKVPTLYHKNIDLLTLDKFIDCIVDGNFAALTISGYPKKADLEAAWGTILSQYTELLGTDEYKMYVSMYKEISLLKITLQQIESCIGILKLGYDEFFAGELNALLRQTCKFNWRDQATYQAELKKCFQRSRSVKIKLDLLQLRYAAIEKRYQQKQEKNKVQKMDREYFSSMLIELSDVAGYHLTDSIKVTEYCGRIKKYRKDPEQKRKRHV